MKAVIYSPDGDTEFFNIVTRVLQGDTFAPYLFMICLDYILWMSIYLLKENCSMQKKSRSRQYPAETITDAAYTDDLTKSPI